MTIRAEDMSVIIPTRDRWHILQETLAGLGGQSVTGFDVVVVVDGDDQQPPPLAGASVLTVPHGGPGAARNAGTRATDRPLLLFLGDDMVPVPDLVARHLDIHNRERDPKVGALGNVRWHPDVAHQPPNQWLDRTRFQFDFESIPGSAASFAHFYSCNVSLHRTLFDAVGGFDPDFTYYYEDLDMGWRLHQAGLRLVFARDAWTEHLHGYAWDALEQRFRGVARGERLMAAKHAWFEPFFAARFSDALRRPPPTALRMCAPRRARGPRLAARAARDETLLATQRMGAAFLGVWHGHSDVQDLQEYLGGSFDPSALVEHKQRVDAEEHAAPDEERFYRTSQAYLYDLTIFGMSGTKEPYRAALERLVEPGARLLDFGCGIGADGLRLLDDGYRVDFADFDNPSTRYLRWRLERRKQDDSSVLDVEGELPTGYDAAFAFDVIEHVDDPLRFLRNLERRAGLVMVNLLEPEPSDAHTHRRLPVASILNRATHRGLYHYRLYHGRSHLVAYAGDGDRSRIRAPLSTRRSWARRIRGHAEAAGARRLLRAGGLLP